MENALLGGQQLEQTLQGREDTSNDNDIPLDLESTNLETEEQEDDFYIEEQGSTLAPSSSVAYDAAHQLDTDHAPFEPEFEPAVEHLELEGDFLPEITNIKDEITSGDFHVTSHAMFATPPMQMNNSGRILDDATLDRLQEEMTRIEQQRRQGVKNGTSAVLVHPGQPNVPSPIPVLRDTHQSGAALQGRARDLQTINASQRQPNHSLLSTIHSNSNSDFNAFDDSDTSPQSEISIPRHRENTRKKTKRDRGDSEGSSASRPLIPLSEETGKRIIVKDRMDQLSVRHYVE